MLATPVPRLTVEDGTPQPEPVVMRGKAGKEVKITANYVRLELLAGDRGMYEYEVRFSPQVDGKDERVKIVNQLRETFGPTKTFDGNDVVLLKLYCMKSYV